MNTNIQVPAAVQALWGKSAHAALTSIVGSDLGSDAAPWRAWYEQHKAARHASPKPESK